MKGNPFERPESHFQFDLATRALEVDCSPASLERIAKLHLMHGEKLLLVASTKFADKYPGVPVLADEDLLIVSKLEHELDHLRRVASTSFGQLIQALFQDFTDQARQLVDVESGELCRGSKASDQALARARGAADAELLLLADCLGELGYRAEAVASGLNAVRRVGGEFDLGKRPYSNLIPSVMVRGEKTVVGAQALLEFQAVSREASYLAYAIGPHAVPIDQLGRVTLYKLAGWIWKNTYGLPMPETSSRTWRTGEQIEPRKRFPVEMTASVDLALWIPYQPSGLTPGLSWQDIHPGHRFLRILDVLAKQERKYTPFESAASVDEQAFEAFQSELCNQLGWPNPTELATQWLSTLEAARDERRLAGDCRRWQCDADYLRTRIKSPGLSVITRPSAEDHPHLWFSALASESSDGSTEIFIPTSGAQGEPSDQRLPISYSLRHVSTAILHDLAGEQLGPVSDRCRRALKSFHRTMWADFRNHAGRT